MALSNAERQRRWRERRNDLAQVLVGKPNQIAEGILSHHGAKEAKRIVQALDKRLRNIKPDCRSCGGTGFMTLQSFTAVPTGQISPPCDCGPETLRIIEDANKRAACSVKAKP